MPTPTDVATATTMPTEAVVATTTPTEVATATTMPTEAATVTPTEVATATTMPTEAATATVAALAPSASMGARLLFLSGGNLVAFDLQRATQNEVVSGVDAFAATTDGRRLALVRAEGREVWVAAPDGSGLQRVLRSEQFVSDLSWNPDGTTLVYTAAATPAPFPPQHQAWSEWCSGAEARIYDLERDNGLSLGQGCQPAFGPDGLRIVFASPPQEVSPGLGFLSAVNTIQMVNQQGENSWSVAQALGTVGEDGLLVYAPSWSPNSGQVAYQRFLGYQALVDINITERSSSYQVDPTPLTVDAGWGFAPVYAPEGQRMAVVTYNYSDARGFSGYDLWRVNLLDLTEGSEAFLPSGTVRVAARTLAVVNGATAAAWAPDGATLALVLPAGWRAELDPMVPQFPEVGPGEVWQWHAERGAERKLAEGVDYGSPLVWLP
ncbi:TolB family protein [Candidatus Viridilinea mediisalina]|uniref:Uncharacterized protein n=1 Tax=Candidatus Viridilinea mediisalina TaxID=2024553 RepID=A0A2A6RFV3_9CHLR|nr:hypothetical protein [Candidatus Viridilinea mediisalina]PDW01740.1 hypothetical protein CJ255_17530 [Candidatus Viridilinea mediisalina]